ncbi:MarR family winged helix-turn-helix transcriptional regulator [Leuconostoc lactis]|uniref:MarR family winged helix-turn-helix transcriptional regulator n=1 Tax=Leuconostoc lactis TaxID=1246 RepID=UPI00102128C7|nr:MarR family transcriptional regulator [Leuconostoc lactis]MSB66140.1 MarR family transcriptional regulator [Leuconostoc lactis]RYS90409.1 MarR family transcriptional regulator [Leuconostoc lactis]
MSKSNTIIYELNTFVQTYAARSEFIKTTTAQKINATQAHLLMLLQEENATNANLANKMNLSKPAITKAVKNLIAHGYVISSQDASDKRSVNYALTPAGIKLARQHEQSHQALHEDIDATIATFTPEQQATIIHFLKQINQLEDTRS